MKKLMFLLMVAFAAMSASAQITWNAKAGLGVAHCWGDADDMSSHFVGKIGAGIEKPLTSDWSLMPSLEIAWKGAKENWEEYGEKGEGTIDLLYLQIPVLAAYRLNINDSWNMTLKAGPSAGIVLCGIWHGRNTKSATLPFLACMWPMGAWLVVSGEGFQWLSVFS